jgi:hypothetical protein
MLTGGRGGGPGMDRKILQSKIGGPLAMYHVFLLHNSLI